MIQSFWIAATPRSGSNFLCDLLYRTAEIQMPKEFLNRDFLKTSQLSNADGPLLVDSIDQLLNSVAEKWGNTRHPLCVKVLYGQLQRNRAIRGLREALKAHPVVLLSRRDIVAQAVSVCLANATGQWTSHSKLENNNADSIAYDFAAIDAAAELLERHHALWRRLFLVLGIKFRELIYEDVTTHPDAAVEEILELWQLPRRTRPVVLADPHQRQTCDVNARFIERYRQEKAEAMWGV